MYLRTLNFYNKKLCYMYHKGLRVIIGNFFCKFDNLCTWVCSYIYLLGGHIFLIKWNIHSKKKRKIFWKCMIIRKNILPAQVLWRILVTASFVVEMVRPICHSCYPEKTPLHRNPRKSNIGAFHQKQQGTCLSD